MIDFVINIIGDIADFFIDLWLNKTVKRKKKK